MVRRGFCSTVAQRPREEREGGEGREGGWQQCGRRAARSLAGKPGIGGDEGGGGHQIEEEGRGSGLGLGDFAFAPNLSTSCGREMGTRSEGSGEEGERPAVARFGRKMKGGMGSGWVAAAMWETRGTRSEIRERGREIWIEQGEGAARVWVGLVRPERCWIRRMWTVQIG